MNTASDAAAANLRDIERAIVRHAAFDLQVDMEACDEMELCAVLSKLETYREQWSAGRSMESLLSGLLQNRDEARRRFPEAVAGKAAG